MGFSSGWGKQQSPGKSGGFGGFFRNPPPVKPQLDRATRDIEVLISRLDQAESRIKQRDESIFRRVVYALRRGDNDHASMYANELSEVRNLGKTVSSARLALEQVSLRLKTITDLGDVAATLAPTIAVVRGVGQGLGGVLPSAEGELNEISSLLSSTLVEAGTVKGTTLNFGAANEEAERVLDEASAVAESRMTEQFPAVPVAVRDEDETEGLTA